MPPSSGECLPGLPWRCRVPHSLYAEPRGTSGTALEEERYSLGASQPWSEGGLTLVRSTDAATLYRPAAIIITFTYSTTIP
jgi:hypothetical protein